MQLYQQHDRSAVNMILRFARRQWNKQQLACVLEGSSAAPLRSSTHASVSSADVVNPTPLAGSPAPSSAPTLQPQSAQHSHAAQQYAARMSHSEANYSFHGRAYPCTALLDQQCCRAGQHRRRHKDTPRLYTFQQVAYRDVHNASALCQLRR